MVIDYIADFTQFLNSNGFEISNDKISRFFTMMSYEDIDFSNHEEILGLMKTIFCSNKNQYLALEEYFKAFMKKKELIADLEKEKMKLSELESKRSELDDSRKSKESKIVDILKEIEEIKKKCLAEDLEYPMDKGITKSDKKFLEENSEKIKNLGMKDENDKKLLNHIADKDFKATLEFTPYSFKTLAKNLVDKSEELLKKSKIEDFIICQTLFSIVNKLEKNVGISNDLVKNEIDKRTKPLLKKKSDLEKEIKDELITHQKNQEKIKQMIADLKKKESELIVKEKSINNREVFMTTGNAVQILDDNYGLFTKSFSSLKEQDIIKVYAYIKDNLLRFKTRMRKSIQTMNRQRVDIKKTIQNACKTGGLPMNIFYEEPKANKTKLVLVLDVSGSCKSASSMMLTFMHLLKSVFPGGCKTYAFVNSLYDISEIMETDNINASIEQVLSTIPTKGVYSNYYKPLRELWIDEKKEITSDSIVIFMGDARNNKNDPGMEYIKNIARRAKRSYWLNTETFENWGVKDSLAFEYCKYFKMFQVTNIVELLGFVDKMK